MKYFVYLQCYLEGVFYASIAIEYCYCELYIVYNKFVIMKKLLFFCALSAFLMPICGVQAQIYAEATSSSPTERGFIRENQIAYYEDGGQGYFIYLPTFSLPSFNRVKIPPTWSIRDFHVINDTAYFPAEFEPVKPTE